LVVSTLYFVYQRCKNGKIQIAFKNESGLDFKFVLVFLAAALFQIAIYLTIVFTFYYARQA